MGQHLAIPEKKKKQGLRTYFFENPLEFFIYFTPGNSREIKAPPLLEIVQNWKFLALETSKEIPRPKQKPGPLEIPHFFLVTLGNATCFLIPLEIPYPQPPPPVCFFFLNSPLNSHTLNSQIKH